jgi:hypothetical protein
VSNADDRARVRRLIVGLQWGTAALAIMAYAAATAGSLVFDDIHSVATNWVLQDTANWWRWISDPTAFSELGSMFRPVVLVSLGLNFAVSDGAFALKAGNVLLHALVVFLAFGWFRRLGTPLWGTFAAMALFAVHPLVSEVVNMVSARSELLLFAGLITALRAQLAYCRGGALLPALGGIALGTVIACGSKETGVVLPGLMIAQAFFARRGPWGRVEWRRLGTTVLPAIALVLVYLLLRKVLLGEATVSLSGRTGADPLSGHGRMLVTQLATMGLLLPRALLQMVWPVGLTLDPEILFCHTFGLGSRSGDDRHVAWPRRRSAPTRSHDDHSSRAALDRDPTEHAAGGAPAVWSAARFSAGGTAMVAAPQRAPLRIHRTRLARGRAVDTTLARLPR